MVGECCIENGIVQPSTPANFTTYLASRTITAPIIHRPTTGSPVHIRQTKQEQSISYTPTNDTGDSSIPHDQTTEHLPTTKLSQCFGRRQYAPPPTPQKLVLTYIQNSEFTFVRSGYSPQRNSLPGKRRPSVPRPRDNTTTGQSGYFSSVGARPWAGSAVDFASGVRARSPVSRDTGGVSGYDISSIRGETAEIWFRCWEV